jgi:predicted RNase H-like HicB family nuclease
MERRQFPVIFEDDANGTVHASIVGLPGVFGVGDTRGQAERAIKEAFELYLDHHALPVVRGLVKVLRLDQGVRTRQVTWASVGTLRPPVRSAAKIRAARMNGRKGGRPRKAVATAR